MTVADPPSGALVALATRHGVAADYVDGRGVLRTPSGATIVKILASLGVPIERPADAEALVDDPAGARAPSPVVIACDGVAELRLGPTFADGELLVAGETERADGDGTVRWRTGMASGVHTIQIESASGALVERHVVVGSRRCAPGPQPPRTWGVFAPIVSLRRSDAPDHGAGGLTALGELADAVIDLGGSVIATLPLVALRPDEASPYSPLTRRYWDERWVDPSWVATKLGIRGWVDRRPTTTSALAEPEHVCLTTRQALAEILEVVGGPAALPDEAAAWRRAHPDVEEWARWKAAGHVWGWDPRTWSAEVGDAVRSGSWDDPDEVDFEAFVQWAVTAQLTELGAGLRARDASLYLDLPIGTPANSYDVWEAPHRFAEAMSVGAPPDQFFPDGQNWSLRPLHPGTASAEGHVHLRQCIEAHLAVCGLLRIDHVMGLHRLFWAPDDAEPGEGTYVTYPAEEQWAVLAALSEQYGTGIVGEDLGTVPDEARHAMSAHGARGLFIGQDEVRTPFRLARPVEAAMVASLNTHDLAPLAAWHAEQAVAGEPVGAAPLEQVRGHLLGELAISAADIVLVSDQDLSLDDRRFNVPGIVGGQTWRLRSTMTIADLTTADLTTAEPTRDGKARRVLERVDAWRRTARGEWPEGVAPRLDDNDIATLHNGTHARLADRLGVHPVSAAGVVGAAASVWAPHASEVVVAGDFDGWVGTPLRQRSGPPHADHAGVWDGFVPSATLGDRYKFRIRGANGHWVEKSDPFARAAELPPGNASILTADDPAEHDWGDGEWMAQRSERHRPGHPMSIYEVHLGTWRRHPDGRIPTYAEVTPWLIDHVTHMGFTHVELMPVMEHPFGGSWGYHVTGYFAPTSRYGTPAEFAWMIDQLHRAGIGVILDWVPAHFPDDAHGLADFDGQALFEHPDPREGRHPQWGSRIFDWGRPEIRAFLVSSARWWIEHYHADGLRVDAVASMLYRNFGREDGDWVANRYGGQEHLEAVDLVRQLTNEIHSSVPGAVVIAEESTAWPGVTRPTDSGGLGFDLKWDLGWMHDMLEYLARDPIDRRWHQDDLTFRALYANSERFVLPLSHDEVVHGKGSLVRKMAGDDWQRRANLRLLFGHQYTVPGVPLMFMGGELAMNEEWGHETALPWWLLDHAPHRGIKDWVAELNRLLGTQPALSALDDDLAGFEWIDCADSEHSVLGWVRRSLRPAETLAVIANFTPAPLHGYRMGMPAAGRWDVLANSDDVAWGGSGYAVPQWAATEPITHQQWSDSVSLTLPPLGLLILRRNAAAGDTS